ncbi:MAG: hypothetical protein J7K68_05085 [Candidatus Diapherotrites archaeon]|nr:hypothetical protein [Candidatus Diapherotrites archaeon]
METIWVVNGSLMFATFVLMLYLTSKVRRVPKKRYMYLSSLLTLIVFWMMLFHFFTFFEWDAAVQTSETMIAFLLIIMGIYYSKVEGYI